MAFNNIEIGISHCRNFFVANIKPLVDAGNLYLMPNVLKFKEQTGHAQQPYPLVVWAGRKCTEGDRWTSRIMLQMRKHPCSSVTMKVWETSARSNYSSTAKTGIGISFSRTERTPRVIDGLLGRKSHGVVVIGSQTSSRLGRRLWRGPWPRTPVGVKGLANFLA